MTLFRYVAAADNSGKITKGSIDASDEASVMEALKKQHLRPLSVNVDKKSSSSFGKLFGPGGVKSDDLVIFTRQLSAMVGAGVPLLRSLSSLEQHSESPGLKAILVN